MTPHLTGPRVTSASSASMGQPRTAMNSRPIKLALVTRRYPPLIGGAEKVFSYLARGTGGRGRRGDRHHLTNTRQRNCRSSGSTRKPIGNGGTTGQVVAGPTFRRATRDFEAEILGNLALHEKPRTVV